MSQPLPAGDPSGAPAPWPTQKPSATPATASGAPPAPAPPTAAASYATPFPAPDQRLGTSAPPTPGPQGQPTTTPSVWPRRLQLIGTALVVVGTLLLVPSLVRPSAVLALLLAAAGAVMLLRGTGAWPVLGLGALVGTGLLTLSHGAASIGVVGAVLVVVGLLRQGTIVLRSGRFLTALGVAVALAAVVSFPVVVVPGGYLGVDNGSGAWAVPGLSSTAAEFIGTTLAVVATGVVLASLATIALPASRLVIAGAVAVVGPLVTAILVWPRDPVFYYDIDGYLTDSSFPDLTSLCWIVAIGVIAAVIAIIDARRRRRAALADLPTGPPPGR